MLLLPLTFSLVQLPTPSDATHRPGMQLPTPSAMTRDDDSEALSDFRGDRLKYI